MQTVTIEKLVYEGYGLGRLEDGQVVLIPFTAPEDKLMINLATKKPFANIESIQQHSPYRQQPYCSVFEECGGCHWQHIIDKAQADAKQHIVNETLERVGKIRQPPVLPIITGDTVFEYRNHVVWHWDGQQLGYYRHHSNNIISFDQCYLIPKPINHMYHQLTDLLSKNPPSMSFDIDIKWSRLDEILLTIIAETKPDDAFFNTLAKQVPTLTGICFQQDSNTIEIIFGQSFIREVIGDYSLQVSAGSFFQSNTNAAEKMINLLSQWLKSNKHQTLLDAYAGVGLFSITLNNLFKEITAVEFSQTSVQDAQTNITANTIKNMTYHQEDVEHFLNQAQQQWHTAIVDPPRSGCSPMVLNRLNEKVTDSLIYISCNPTTLARDLKHLLASEQWKIIAVQPFDFFPQTYHVETAVFLQRQ